MVPNQAYFNFYLVIFSFYVSEKQYESQLKNYNYINIIVIYNSRDHTDIVSHCYESRIGLNFKLLILLKIYKYSQCYHVSKIINIYFIKKTLKVTILK